jgi:hypothetical protein
MPVGEAEQLGLEPQSAAPAMTGAARAVMRSMLGRLADFLLPPVCISCGARVGSHGLLCGTCFAKIDFITPPLCARLGVPLPFEAGDPPLSAAAIASPPVYDRARAAARYSDTMRELVQSFKYRDRHEGLPLFARWLNTAGAELLADADLILPVPLYPTRLWRRRFKSIGHARYRSRPAQWRSGRLLHIEAGAGYGKPSGSQCEPAAAQCCRCIQGGKGQDPRT